MAVNVLYISHLHPPKDALTKNIGGMQRVSMQLADELDRVSGIHLIRHTNETSWRFIGLKSFWFLLKLYLNLPRMIRRENVDIILFSSMVTGSLSWFARRRINIPMVSITHGHDVTLQVPIYQWLLRKVFQSLDGVISVSSATNRQCIKRGLPPDKGKVLPNGFVPLQIEKTFTPQESKKYFNDYFGLNLNEEFLLLTVGRFIKRKGHKWFIEEVLPRITSPVVYMMIGDGPEGNSIQNSINNSTSGHKILNMGRQPDDVLKRAYSAADLFIMPNIRVRGDMEGFGVVLLEANISNTPAVTSDLEGIRDVIAQGINGYRVPVRNAKEFAGKIDYVLKYELASLSVTCREYAYENFRWDTVAQRYVEYLNEVIRRKGQGGP